MTSTALNRSARNPEIEYLIELLQESFPEREDVQTKLKPLLDNKKNFIAELDQLWDQKDVPHISADRIEAACSDFANQENAKPSLKREGRRLELPSKCVKTYNNSTKGCPATFGYDPFAECWEQIQYDGPVNFQKLFGHLVDYDEVSKSINLFDSLRKVIIYGERIGLSNMAWQKNHFAVR